MIEINGKEYEINTDVTLGTEKLMGLMMKDPDNPKNFQYMERIIKDILVPSPDTNEINKFRRSDRNRIFDAFASEVNKINADLKKKRSIL